MKIKRKVLTSFILSVLMVSQIAQANEIKDKDKVFGTVNGEKMTEQNLDDTLRLNQSYGPALEVLDFKVMEKKYQKDSRLQGVIDENYKALLEEKKDTDKDLKKEFAFYNVKDKDNYIKKSGLLLAAYRELASMDISYEKIFTKSEKDYIYKNKFSGQADIYSILISPKASSSENVDSAKIKTAKAEALKTAEKVIAELDKGMKFEEAVVKYSDNKVNASGLIGNYNVDTAKEKKLDNKVVEAAFELENNKYSAKPVETQYGYEILMVKYSKEKESYKKVKDSIAKELFTLYKTNNTNIGEYALTLYRKEKKISFDDSTLSKAYANSVINSRKTYLQFDPNSAAAQNGNYGY